MKNSLYVLLLALLTGCCHCDYSIPVAYTDFMKNYKTGDTVSFADAQKDTEGFYVTSIDSIFSCGGFLGGPREEIIVRIKNFPDNNWNDGEDMPSPSNGNKVKVIDQGLVCFSKRFYEDQKNKPYWLLINYRDFSREPDDINYRQRDSLYFQCERTSSKYNKNQYAIQYKPGATQPSSVAEIIWTKKYGLTAYYKDNGSFYKIIDKMGH